MPGKQNKNIPTPQPKPVAVHSPEQPDLYETALKWAPYIILAITALVYIKGLYSEFTLFDDDTFIIKNPLVLDSSFEGIKNIFTTFNAGKYQPITIFSFAIEHSLFGFDPFIFHFTDLLLHLSSTFLVFKIAERLSGQRITAIVVALLFGIHPMHVEEVAWASERKDMMYAFFYLLSIWCYLRYTDTGYRVKYYVLTFLFFLLSLFSKTEAITLPLVLILVDVYLHRKITLKVILEKVPLLAFSVVIFVLGQMSHQADGAISTLTPASYGFINRIFLFTTVPAFYIIKLVAPFGLSAMHYYPDLHDGHLPWMYYASLPFMLVIVWLIIRRSSFRREIIFGVSFFLITICVMPQLLSVGPSLTPERYSYIPYIGFFYIIGVWMATIGIPRWKKPAIGLFTCFALMCGIVSWLRIDVWKNNYALLNDVLQKNADVADCSFFYWLRGNAGITNGDLPGAIADYNQAIAEHPRYMEAYANQGAAYFQAGDLKSAIADFDMAIRIKPQEPLYYYNRASAKASAGMFPEALVDYNAYLQLKPDNNTAYTDRGMVRMSMGDTVAACEDWRKAASMGNGTAPQLIQQFCH